MSKTNYLRCIPSVDEVLKTKKTKDKFSESIFVKYENINGENIGIIDHISSDVLNCFSFSVPLNFSLDRVLPKYNPESIQEKEVVDYLNEKVKEFEPNLNGGLEDLLKSVKQHYFASIITNLVNTNKVEEYYAGKIANVKDSKSKQYLLVAEYEDNRDIATCYKISKKIPLAVIVSNLELEYDGVIYHILAETKKFPKVEQSFELDGLKYRMIGSRVLNLPKSAKKLVKKNNPIEINIDVK